MIKSKSDDGVSQIVFYDKGVGTGDLIDRALGGLAGKGLQENIIDGYRFLANNYSDGDEIFIFGFSRGAFTARSLAGLVASQGLIKPHHLGKKLIRMINICETHEKSPERNQAIAMLELERHENIPIECVGVWDTVGSLGIPTDLGATLLQRNQKFHDLELHPSVKVALHAVAVDEKRGPFPPALWIRKLDKAAPEHQIVEQVWFSGVHSNIGGSYEDEGLSNITLDWMIKRLKKFTGLSFDEKSVRQWNDGWIAGKGIESRTALYSTSKAYPYQRLINQNIPPVRGLGGWFKDKIKLLDRRNLIEDPTKEATINEKLHVSVLQRWELPKVMHDVSEKENTESKYRPINVAAVIANKGIAVVGLDGEDIPPQHVEWPDLES